jgi:CrcB protein
MRAVGDRARSRAAAWHAGDEERGPAGEVRSSRPTGSGVNPPDPNRLALPRDVRSADRRPRAVHLQPVHLGVVALGGAVGTAAREALSITIPSIGGFPVAVLAINVSGAFVLGLLLEALARRGPDEGRRRLARLLVGTGFCGGFTTYSSLSASTAVLLATGAAGPAVLYSLGTLLVGGAASWAGIAFGALRDRRR